MKKIQFKTNINCGGCIAKVTPQLSEGKGIKKWNVDTETPQKVLTIETEHLTAKQVIALLHEAGFKAEMI